MNVEEKLLDAYMQQEKILHIMRVEASNVGQRQFDVASDEAQELYDLEPGKLANLVVGLFERQAREIIDLQKKVEELEQENRKARGLRTTINVEDLTLENIIDLENLLNENYKILFRKVLKEPFVDNPKPTCNCGCPNCSRCKK